MEVGLSPHHHHFPLTKLETTLRSGVKLKSQWWGWGSFIFLCFYSFPGFSAVLGPPQKCPQGTESITQLGFARASCLGKGQEPPKPPQGGKGGADLMWAKATAWGWGDLCSHLHPVQQPVSLSPVLLPALMSSHPSHVLPTAPNLPWPRCHTREGLVCTGLGLTDAALLPATHGRPISQSSSGSAALWVAWTGT